MKLPPFNRKNLVSLCLVLGFFATACVVLLLIPPGSKNAHWLPRCWFHEWTGLYCPGCGGTRALRALAHGQVADSLRLHPLVLPAVAFTAVFLVTLLLNKLSNGRTPKPHFRRIYLVILIALLLYHVIAANVGGELI